MNGKFFLAAIPEPHTILGLRLKPFCAGHIALLYRTENALLLGGDVDESQLEQQLSAAVFFCAQSYEEGLASLDDPDTPKFLKKWGRKIGSFNAVEKLEAFRRYIEDGSSIPQYAVKGSAAESINRSIDVPTMQIVKCTLLREFGGMTESEFMNRPWGLCLWDFVTIKAIIGDVDVYEKETIPNARSVADAIQAKFTNTPCPA